MYGQQNITDWEKVIFADETKVYCFAGEGNQWVWGERGKSNKPYEISEVLKSGGCSVSLWGCITSDGFGYLSCVNPSMDAQLFIGIMNDEFKKTLDQYEWNKTNLLLFQDNDSVHTAKKSEK